VKLLDLTLETPEDNLALDEALLDEADEASRPAEVLRIWESPHPIVVVGRSSRVAAEVDDGQCHRRGIPILRRSSGGASVVVGPGCLMYSVVLSCVHRPQLRMISEAHRLVLGVLADSLGAVVSDVRPLGTSDLTLGDRKFSGNSMRSKRTHLLYHGTLLYDFPLHLISTCLRVAPRQPEYRQSRNHAEFVTNLPATAAGLRTALVEGWNAREALDEWPRGKTQELVETKYSKKEWNFRL